MSANKKAPAVPYVVMEEGPGRSLVDQGSCYLTSARALMDFVMEDLNVATDQMWGLPPPVPCRRPSKPRKS
ncbi:hypothetical protein SNK04_014135 [Fusarium graminearum]